MVLGRVRSPPQERNEHALSAADVKPRDDVGDTHGAARHIRGACHSGILARLAGQTDCAMCGIAGEVVRRARGSPEVVERQLSVLCHRGPDAVGTFAAGRCVIGQTRLSVIDLDTGDPPIASERDVVGVALNGEIYNFRELRDGALRRGHEFRTKGDTEVICHLTEDLRPTDVARSLDGMFAYATWDSDAETLVLGRDRFGKKPLYYWAGQDRFVFASEIKALLTHPEVATDLDVAAIPAYLRFGYVPSPRTFFTGIRSVPPGHVLVLDRSWEIRIEPYWRLAVPGVDAVEPRRLSLDEAASEVRQQVRRAVERRLVSDVPLGAFLSGGIDSTAVVAAMSDLIPGLVRTFTIGFDDHAFDERGPARLVAARFGTDHEEFVVRPDAVELVDSLVWHYDQPFGDSSAIPTYLLSKMTRQHVTVALCGDGGDEAYAGYERFAAAKALASGARLPATVRGLVASLAAALPEHGLPRAAGRARRMLTNADVPVVDAYRAWIEYVPRGWRDRLVPDGIDWSEPDYRRKWDATAGADVLTRLQVLNLETYLLDDLLPKVDRMSMAHGLEVRAPLLDHELMQHALLLSPALRARGLSLKRVLKHSLRGIAPDEILRRPKRGFGVPLDRWFRSSMQAYVHDCLGPSSRVRHHIAGDALASMLAEHRAGHHDHGDALWTLLTLEVFLRRHGW